MKNKKLILALGVTPLLLNCGRTSVTEVKIYYRPNNGQEDFIVTTKPNTKSTKPTNPTKKNCKFDAWFQGEDFWSFDFNTFTKDTELDARYTIDQSKFKETEVNPEKKHNNGNLRVMSFNVLTQKYNNVPKHNGTNEFNEADPNASRDRDMVDTVEEYQPDVIGFQELDYIAYQYINNRSGINYELINKDYIVDDDNPRTETETGKKDDSYFNAIFSTLAYNKNTIEKVGAYQIKYHGVNADNHDCRYLTMQVFKHKATNKRFIATSTHWNLSSLTNKEKNEGMTLKDKAEKNLRQEKESAIWTLLFQKLNGDIPVITTGDYNARDARETYKAFIHDTNFQDTKYTAKERGLTCDTSHIGHGERSTEDSKWDRGITSVYNKHVSTCFCIDHIFASKNITPVYYDTISTTKALNCSDHMPIYTDFIL